MHASSCALDWSAPSYTLIFSTHSWTTLHCQPPTCAVLLKDQHFGSCNFWVLLLLRVLCTWLAWSASRVSGPRIFGSLWSCWGNTTETSYDCSAPWPATMIQTLDLWYLLCEQCSIKSYRSHSLMYIVIVIECRKQTFELHLFFVRVIFYVASTAAENGDRILWWWLRCFSGLTLDRLALSDQETILNPMVHFDLEMAHTII